MHFCVCMHVQFVHTYASVIALFPCPFLSMSILTCSVKDRTGKPSTMRSPPSNGLFLQSWTRMMCHRWLCHCIPVPVLTLSNYHTNSLMRRLSMIMRAIYYYCDWKLLLRSAFPHLLLLFFSLSSPISASYSPLSPPLLPSLSPHSLVSGWKVQWGCGIPEGQGVCLLPHSAVCVQIRGLLIGQSKLSAVAGDCAVVCGVPWEGWKV